MNITAIVFPRQFKEFKTSVIDFCIFFQDGNGSIAGRELDIFLKDIALMISVSNLKTLNMVNSITICNILMDTLCFGMPWM